MDRCGGRRCTAATRRAHRSIGRDPTDAVSADVRLKERSVFGHRAAGGAGKTFGEDAGLTVRSDLPDFGPGDRRVCTFFWRTRAFLQQAIDEPVGQRGSCGLRHGAAF